MRKRHPEHANHERWLVSYADFITLLFAFFVIMYAISQADIEKFRKVSASMKRAFSVAGTAGFVDTGGASGGDTVNPFEAEEPKGGRAVGMPAGKTNTASDPDPRFQELREMLEESVSLEIGTAEASDHVTMQFDSRGLLVTLAAKGLFPPGEAVVSEDMRPLLDRIGRVLAKPEVGERLVRIEGHADISETKAKGYPEGGWELSSARAAWIARYWVDKFKIDPKRLGAAGYSHYRSLSSGTEPWEQAKNRRVEILILRNKFSD